jgi:hypothetical protein
MFFIWARFGELAAEGLDGRDRAQIDMDKGHGHVRFKVRQIAVNRGFGRAWQLLRFSFLFLVCAGGRKLSANRDGI